MAQAGLNCGRTPPIESSHVRQGRDIGTGAPFFNQPRLNSPMRAARPEQGLSSGGARTLSPKEGRSLKHELGLLENVLDSLNEALRKFQPGESGEPRAYKFAVLHFAQALELLFKYYVTQSHPLLIYKNPI